MDFCFDFEEGFGENFEEDFRVNFEEDLGVNFREDFVFQHGGFRFPAPQT